MTKFHMICRSSTLPKSDHYLKLLKSQCTTRMRGLQQLTLLKEGPDRNIKYEELLHQITKASGRKLNQIMLYACKFHNNACELYFS